MAENKKEGFDHVFIGSMCTECGVMRPEGIVCLPRFTRWVEATEATVAALSKRLAALEQAAKK